jgi:hypothetical protein
MENFNSKKRKASQMIQTDQILVQRIQKTLYTGTNENRKVARVFNSRNEEKQIN